MRHAITLATLPLLLLSALPAQAALDLATEWLDGDRERLHSGFLWVSSNTEGAVGR